MRISLVLRSFEAARARVPSIKFRGGVNAQLITQAQSGRHQNGASASSSRGGSTYEDFQMPTRFRRQLLDDREIDAINSGGAF